LFLREMNLAQDGVKTKTPIQNTPGAFLMLGALLKGTRRPFDAWRVTPT
jgi:hypothetical protein